MKKSKFKPMSLIRHLIQLTAFILFPGFFVMTFTGIRSIISAVIAGTWTVSTMGMTTVMVVGVLLITALLGRFFCGFICSFGAAGDLFHFIGKSLHLPQVKIPHEVDSVLKYIKYVVLAVVVIFGWILGFSAFSGTNDPWNVFGMAFTINNPDFSVLISIGGLILLAIFAASLFIERFFCRYLCPLGAIFSITSKGRFFRLRKPTANCGKCTACTHNCSMGIDLRGTDIIDSGECIDCMECKNICPKNNISTAVNPSVVAIASAAALAGCYYAGNIVLPVNSTNSTTTQSTTSNSTDSGSETTSSDSSTTSDSSTSGSTSSDTSSSTSGSTTSGTFTDGTYTGSGQGYRGTTNVTVTVSGGKITDVTVDSYQDDDQFFNRAKSTIISEVVDAQSVNVDTVSGATFSSQGLLEAIANALNVDYTSSNSSSGSQESASQGFGGHGGH